MKRQRTKISNQKKNDWSRNIKNNEDQLAIFQGGERKEEKGPNWNK
jgi:hypothetical protein